MTSFEKYKERFAPYVMKNSAKFDKNFFILNYVEGLEFNNDHEFISTLEDMNTTFMLTFYQVFSKFVNSLKKKGQLIVEYKDRSTKTMTYKDFIEELDELGVFRFLDYILYISFHKVMRIYDYDLHTNNHTDDEYSRSNYEPEDYKKHILDNLDVFETDEFIDNYFEGFNFDKRLLSQMLKYGLEIFLTDEDIFEIYRQELVRCCEYELVIVRKNDDEEYINKAFINTLYDFDNFLDLLEYSNENDIQKIYVPL